MKIATADDLADLERMSMNFLNSSPYLEFGDKDTIVNLIENFIKGDPSQKIIIIKPGEGFIIGTVVPFLFGPHLLATEIAWWVEPESRGSGTGKGLLEAFEYWAKNVANCKLISMGSIDKTVEKYYKKKGYKLHERAYMKVL